MGGVGVWGCGGGGSLLLPSGGSGLGWPCSPFISGTHDAGVEHDQHLNCNAANRVGWNKAPCCILCVAERCTLHTTLIFATHRHHYQMLGWPGLCPVPWSLLLVDPATSISFWCSVVKWFVRLSALNHVTFFWMASDISVLHNVYTAPAAWQTLHVHVFTWFPLRRMAWTGDFEGRVGDWGALLPGKGSGHWSSTSCWLCNQQIIFLLMFCCQVWGFLFHQGQAPSSWWA